MLNVCADALASLGQNVTATVPVSELRRLGGVVRRDVIVIYTLKQLTLACREIVKRYECA
jgi:hypothetical protein